MSGSTVIRELVAALGIEVDEASVVRADSALATLAKGALVVSAAVTAAGAALVAMVHQTANAANEARLMSATAGVATDTFQELGYAAETVGVGLGDLRDVFLDVSERAQAAKEGAAEYAAVFKGLGVQVTDTSGKLKSADVLFYEIADAFAKMPPSIDRTAYASRLLGETGARLVPLLNKGSAAIKEMGQEARDMGLIFSEQAIKDAEGFGIATGRLGASLQGLRNTVAGPFIPLISRLADVMTKIVKAIRPIAAKRAEEFAKKAEKWADRVEKWLKDLDSAFDLVGKATERWRLVVVALVSVLAAQYLPTLAAITAAQWAWGSAALIAGARAAAGAAVAMAAWALLAAVIILAADELYTFATGGDSVLGRFIKYLETIDPEDNGLVRMLKRAGALVFDFTDPKKWSAFMTQWQALELQMKASITKVVLDAFKIAWLYLKNSISNIKFTGFGFEVRESKRATRSNLQAEWREQEMARAKAFAEAPTLGELATRAAAGLQNASEWAARVAPAQSGALGLVDTSPPANLTPYFGRGGSPETAIASAQGWTGGVSSAAYAPNITLQQTVQAAPGMSAVDVGNAATDRASETWNAELRRTFEAVNRK